MENAIVLQEGEKRQVFAFQLNSRFITVVILLLCSTFFIWLFAYNILSSDQGLTTNLRLRNLPPSHEYWLGTDWLGRDMFERTTKGLYMSFKVGFIAAVTSVCISCILGIASAVLGRKVDYFITLIIDLFMSMPHLVLLILISFAIGGDTFGVVFAVAVTHWPRLSRIIRAEILQLQQSEYVKLSYKFGKSRLWVMGHHMLPHLFPQLLIGLFLLFPHVILHSAGLTFLGFGLTPHNPSIGILLSESMRFLSTGYWWLAVFPGIALVSMVKIFDIMGMNIKRVLDPKTKQV